MLILSYLSVEVLVGTKLDLTDENATLAIVSKYSNNNFESGLLSVPKYILDRILFSRSLLSFSNFFSDVMLSMTVTDILSYLTLREIGRCSQLSKTWHLYVSLLLFFLYFLSFFILFI